MNHPFAPLSCLLASLCLFMMACEAKEAQHTHGSHHHDHTILEPRAEITPVVNIPLEPSAGREIGLIYESYLSPHQEANEEEDTPELAPDVFKSTKPSTPREKRLGRGHGIVAFTKDFSRAYVQLEISGIDPKEINMVHLHCGLPGMLGPIIVDFGQTGDVSEYFADGRLNLEIKNRDLERVIEHGSGIVGAFTAGCPINPVRPDDRVRNLVGMATVAKQGHLYFNVHTNSQTFYGDIRGQLFPRGAVSAHDITPSAPLQPIKSLDDPSQGG